MRKSTPWILIISLSAAADWLFRVLTDFDMPRVLAFEAVIFPASALAMGLLRRRSPASGRKSRAFQTVLVWTFALAGLRSAMVAVGTTYLWANAVPACLAVLGMWISWRRRRNRPLDRDSTDGAMISVCLALICFTGCGTEAPEAEPESASPAPSAEQSAVELPVAFRDRIPEELLVAHGACPFECCTYRDWKAPVPLPRLDAPIHGSPVDTIAVDEAFGSITGTVFITGIQLVIVRDSLNGLGEVRPPLVASRSEWKAVFLPGDTVVTLDYIGEGFYRVWDGTETREVQQFWWSVDDQNAAPDWASHGHASGAYGSEWWIQSRRSDGVEGWFRAPDQYIPGSDACGVD